VGGQLDCLFGAARSGDEERDPRPKLMSTPSPAEPIAMGVWLQVPVLERFQRHFFCSSTLDSILIFHRGTGYEQHGRSRLLGARRGERNRADRHAVHGQGIG